MTPWYIKHKAGEEKNGKKRKNDSFVFYYICANQRKGWKAANHRNYVLARRAEEWVLERLRDLLGSPTVLEVALE